MAIDYSIIKSHLLKYIRRGISDQHAQFSQESLRSFFLSKGINLDEDVNDLCKVQQIIHEFYIEGIINPGRKLRPQTTRNHGQPPING